MNMIIWTKILKPMKGK